MDAGVFQCHVSPYGRLYQCGLGRLGGTDIAYISVSDVGGRRFTVYGRRNLVAGLRGTERVEVFGRELSHDSIRRSNATVVMSFGVLLLFIFIISILEPGTSLLAITFECVSALSTVGSSLNLTPRLGDDSKLLVALLMFVGRVGLITLMLGIIKQKKHTKYQYPSGQIIIN